MAALFDDILIKIIDYLGTMYSWNFLVPFERE